MYFCTVTKKETIGAQARDLANKIRIIATRWFEIGVLLGISVGRLMELQPLHENDFHRTLNRIIEEWMNTTRPEHRTWQFLAAVIGNEAGGGNSALAKQLTDYSHGLQGKLLHLSV